MCHAPAGEGGHRGLVADVDVAADECRRRDADTVEVDVGGPGALLAHLAVVLGDRDACRLGGHQEHGDAGTVLVGGTDPREGDEQIRQRCVGDEALGAVDDPVAVLLLDGLGAQTRGVRPGAGLGECERGDHLARGDALEPRGLLLVGAEVHQYLSGDAVVGAEHRPERECGVPELLRQFDVLRQVEAEAAPLLRNRVAEQSDLLGGRDQISGNRVVVGDLPFPRYHPGPDELVNSVLDLGEVLGTDL